MPSHGYRRPFRRRRVLCDCDQNRRVIGPEGFDGKDSLDG